MSEPTKYEFYSEGWVSLARDSLVAAAAHTDLEGVRFSFCEVFTDPPAHLLGHGESTIGWYVSVADGELRPKRWREFCLPYSMVGGTGFEPVTSCV